MKFNTVSWAKNAVLYEVNIRQYTPEGTFNSFAKHLTRLKDMGVDIIWLMPITPISYEKRQGTLGSYYACSSYTKINHEFGTLNDLKSLIQKAHELNMKVIIDWVANHTGCDHEWIKNNQSYYRLDADGNFTERNGWKDVIDLNYENHELRKAMIDAMLFWVNECDIDGFRCDMAHLVPLNFWFDARKSCDVKKSLYWLAECDEAEYLQVFDTSYAWNWMHATEKIAKTEMMVSELYPILNNYSENNILHNKLLFTSNHDENSWNGTEYEKYGKLAKAFAVFTFTWYGTPLIYSGQELPNLKRLQFFDKDLIEWSADIKLHQFYKQLSALHKQNIVIYGEIIVLPTQQNIMAYIRKFKDQVLLVMLNLSYQDRVHVTVSHPTLLGEFTSLFSGYNYFFNKENKVELMAGEYLVYTNFVF